MSDLWQTTEDGSLTLRDPETGEHFHNRAGAYTEALEHYIQPANLIPIIQKTGQLRLLDACFGLGYNTFVALAHLLSFFQQTNHPFEITVIAIDRAPENFTRCHTILTDPRLYPLKNISAPFEHNIYYQTLKSPHCFTINVAENRQIRFECWIDDLRTTVSKLTDPVDRIFHDPFSPRTMPELWSLDLFREYHRLLQPRQGMLLTYSSAVAVRGGLRDAGFALCKTPPLGRKSGGTVAFSEVCPLADLEKNFCLPLSAEEEALLTTRSALPYRDPSLKSDAKTVLKLRQSALRFTQRPRRHDNASPVC